MCSDLVVSGLKIKFESRLTERSEMFFHIRKFVALISHVMLLHGSKMCVTNVLPFYIALGCNDFSLF